MNNDFGIVPFLFDEDLTLPVVAPFFTDIDISEGIGQINYETHTRSSSESILNLVNSIINKQTETEFNGNWLLVATWDNVPQFGGDYNIVSIVSCFIMI